MDSTLLTGIGGVEIALTVNRVALGVFFSISGYHKLFNRARHATLVETLKANHIPYVGFNQWWVPSVECAGGMALVVGLLTPLAAMGLLAICVVATCSDGLQRVKSYSPINHADFVDDLLYLPEVLYSSMLMLVITGGAGKFSIDYLILNGLPL